jgi:hypothetical protein
MAIRSLTITLALLGGRQLWLPTPPLLHRPAGLMAGGLPTKAMAPIATRFLWVIGRTLM